MLRPHMFTYVLSLISFFSFIHGIPLVSSTTPTIHSLTASNRMVTCTDSRRWIPRGDTFNPRDCRDALGVMYRTEGNKRADQRFEFLQTGTPQKTRFLPLWTPRIYSAGTCTIAITMLSSYKPWDLPPGERTGPFPVSETATLGELTEGAKVVVNHCVEGNDSNEQAGWDAEGWSSLGIAVTVWQTGSPMDRLVRAQVPKQLQTPVTNGIPVV